MILLARLSDIIEGFIKSMLKETEDGIIEIQRNELAEHFDCAPSQINYVLTTRFTSDRGYYIESRRGGGGYIRVVRASIDENDYINDLMNNVIGASLTRQKAYSLIEDFVEEKLLSKREGEIVKTVLSERSLGNDVESNKLRANIFKNLLIILTN